MKIKRTVQTLYCIHVIDKPFRSNNTVIFIYMCIPNGTNWLSYHCTPKYKDNIFFYYWQYKFYLEYSEKHLFLFLFFFSFWANFIDRVYCCKQNSALIIQCWLCISEHESFYRKQQWQSQYNKQVSSWNKMLSIKWIVSCFL